MLSVFIVCFLLIYIGFILKYLVVEQMGVETTATITAKDEHYLTRVEARGHGGLLKALLGRHKLYYRFEDARGKRYFGQARVNDFAYENYQAEDTLPVLYLPIFPRLNCLKALLLIRFRELMTIGGLFILANAFGFGMNAVFSEPESAPHIHKRLSQEDIERLSRPMDERQKQMLHLLLESPAEQAE